MPELDADEIRHALQTARKGGFAFVRLRQGSTSFSAQLGENLQAPVPDMIGSAVVEDSSVTEAVAESDNTVKATAVGYLRINTTVGQQVEAGQVLAEVVALGLSNEITTELAGSVLELLAADGDPVEFGQPIAKVGPA